MAQIELSGSSLDAIPPALRRIASELAIRGVSNLSMVYGAVKSYLIRTCGKVPSDETTRLYESTVQAVVWIRGYRTLRCAVQKGSTVSVEMGRRQYVVHYDIDKRRICHTRPTSDPLEKSGRYMCRPADHFWRGQQLVREWFARGMIRAVGHALDIKATYAIRSVTYAFPQYARVVYADGTSDDVERISWLIDSSKIKNVVFPWSSLRRLHVHRVFPIGGFLPVDVIEDKVGKPIRVVAFCYRKGKFCLTTIPWEGVKHG